MELSEKEEIIEDTGKEEISENTEKTVQKPKKKNFFLRHKKLFIFLIILAVLIVVFFVAMFPKITAMKNKNMEQTQDFEKIERRDISNTVAVTGTVAAKEKRTLSTLVANTKVMTVDVKVGDRVTKGQRICVFDSSSIEEKMANLEKQMDIASTRTNESVTKAQTTVNKANTNMANDYVDNTTNAARLKQNYDDAMRDYYNACDGYSDAKTTRDDAKSAFESTESSYNSAKSNYDQIPDSYKAGAVDEEDKNEKWDNWIKEYNYWSQLYSSAKTAYDSAANKVTTYENNIQNAEKAVRTAKQNLDDANIKTDRTLISDYTSVAEAELSQTTTNVEARATNDTNKEQMDDYQTQLDNTVITSPLDGIVTSLSVTEGDEFANSTKSEVCVIQDDSGWIINGNVDQYDISKVREGMKAVVKTDATGDDEMEGTVTFVSPVPASSSAAASTAGNASSSSSATYPIEITLNERDDRIRIGMTAETSIVLEQVENVLAVPYDCIKEKEDGTCYITVADEKGGFPAPGKDEGKTPASNGTFGKPVKEGDNEGDDEKKNGPPAGFGKKPGGRPEITDIATKDITVKKGLETDYYTEIISDEVKEGMQVLVPETNDSSDGMFPGGDFMMVGGPGPEGGF